MAVLNWGECDLKHATSTDGAPTGEWDELPTPKEDSTQLTTTAGTERPPQKRAVRSSIICRERIPISSNGTSSSRKARNRRLRTTTE